MVTEPEALKLVEAAAAVFPSYTKRDLQPTAKVWAEMLTDAGLDYDIARQALKNVLAGAKTFPKIAEILEAAQTVHRPEEEVVVVGARFDRVDENGAYSPDPSGRRFPSVMAALTWYLSAPDWKELVPVALVTQAGDDPKRRRSKPGPLRQRQGQPRGREPERAGAVLAEKFGQPRLPVG